MHSNFITPPDEIQSILILNATEEQIKECADACRNNGTAYNVYFYNDEMDQDEWLSKIRSKIDVTIDANISNPTDYFNK